MFLVPFLNPSNIHQYVPTVFNTQGIGKTGVNIVRVGRPEAIREDVKSYALDGRWKELQHGHAVVESARFDSPVIVAGVRKLALF